jgi:UV DNA damage endonuclease
MILPKNVVPSLCCIHIGLQKTGVKFNVMTYAQYKKLGKQAAMKVLADRSYNNIKTIHSIVKECAKQGWNYRIGSNVFPLMTHPDLKFSVDDFYNASEIYAEFRDCADTIKQNKIRCSMHPDQFVVPASPNSKVRENAIRDLEQHAYIMDLLDLPKTPEAPINIHMNCYNNGNFSEAADRFIQSYNLMSNSVRSRLVLEAEDKGKSWNTKLLYEHVYKRINMPITYDSHHHRCGNTYGNLTPEQACDLARITWGNHKPLFHFSNGKKSPIDRAHSDCVYQIHEELFKCPTDVDFEFKLKEQSINKFVKKFSILDTVCTSPNLL